MEAARRRARACFVFLVALWFDEPMARLYGIGGDDLRGVREHLERELKLRFEEHDGLLGRYALHQGLNGERIQLRPNISPVTGEFAELNHPDQGILLYVEGCDVSTALQAIGPAVVLIRET